MSSESSRLVETKSQVAPWWRPLPAFPEATRSLLTQYSNIKNEDVDEHIANFRKRAWEIRPYPCVGMWAFLKPNVQWAQLDNEYDEVLKRVKGGASILDVGCAMAQDLRWLASDGAPTESMYATDLVPEFWDASFDLFRDRSKMHARFICSDVFDRNSELLRELSGSINIFVCGDFFHLFDWQKQIEAATQLIKLSQARPGSMFIGKQIGRHTGKAVTTGWGNKDVLFMHNEDTFRKMWNEIENNTGTSWEVKTRAAVLGEGGFWGPKEDFEWMGEEAIGLQFVVTRR